MCERYSWIEDNGAVLFLTGEDVYNTKRGEELQQWSCREEDYIGHGAIRFYFNIPTNGIDKECTNFSTPDNFPIEIVQAIKAGKMRRFGCNINMLKMLTPTALKKLSELDKARVVYDKDYVAYVAYVAYDKACVVYDKDYVARVAFDKACANNNDKFWDIFAVKTNRRKCWR